MSHTRKDRHQWKHKIRIKTQESDPHQIKLHRKRYVSLLERKSQTQNKYDPIVFRVRLEYNSELSQTNIFLNQELKESLPYIVSDTKDCEYIIYDKIKKDYNSSLEKDILSQHINKVKYLKTPCHLSSGSNKKICSSIVECKNRSLGEEGLPYCRLEK
ncbi:MAG: hypothetical protein ACP5OG_04385 [Candidatus Nanoarchaeia archaeon]